MSKSQQANSSPKKLQEVETKTDIWRYRAFLMWAIIGGIIVAAVVFLGLSRITSALLPFAVALLLWFILKGVVDWCEVKGLPRVWGTTIAFILFALVWVALSLVVFPVLGSQISDLIKNFPDYIEEATKWFESLGRQYKQLEPSGSSRQLVDSAAKQVVSWASALATTSGTKILAGATGAVSFIVGIFMAFILAFWMLKDAPRIGKEVRTLVSDRWKDDFDFFVGTAGRSVGGYLRGTLISSACTGILATIGFSIIGLPYALILGLITAFMNIIPMVGPWISGLIAAIVGLFISPVTAVLSITTTIVSQQLTDTFVSPRVMSKNVEIHPIMVIVGLLIGGSLFGIIGTIVSIPLLAIIKSIFVYYFERKTGKNLATPDGALFPKSEPKKKRKKRGSKKENSILHTVEEKAKEGLEKIEDVFDDDHRKKGNGSE